jgi:membrane peptidoglycan carboxypeptidase
MRYDNMTLSNWRIIDLDGDLSFSFSLNPATPRIAYVELNSLSNVVQRYNTATNRVENTGNWPWRPAVGSINWLQNNLNDTWFVAMGNNVTVVAWRPSDGLQRTYSGISGLDEPHIDREQAYAYLAVNNVNQICNLLTGAAPFVAAGDPAWSYHPNSLENNSHVSPLRGHLTGIANSANQAYWTYNVLTNTTRSFSTANGVIGFPNEWHQAGQWVFNNGDGNEAQWFAIDPSGSDWSAAAIRSGMIGLVNTDGVTPPRLLAVHNSTGGSNYQTQPHVTIAPDGKFVMWTSDSKSTRTDVYLVRAPVR